MRSAYDTAASALKVDAVVVGETASGEAASTVLPFDVGSTTGDWDDSTFLSMLVVTCSLRDASPGICDAIVWLWWNVLCAGSADELN